MKTNGFLMGALTAALVLSAASAQAATEMFTFTDSVDGIFASGQLTVSDTANALGTFDITGIDGSVMNASLPTPASDMIAGLVGNPAAPNPTDAYGFQFDNVAPLNTNGVLFSGASGALYNLWSNGGTAGELYTYGLPGVPNFDAKGTLSVGPGVPEPASWAMMLMGFAGLGAAVRSRRAKLALA